MVSQILMPDHLHMVVGIPGDSSLSKLVRDFKRIAARKVGIEWQRNFFDHRLRHDESETEKYDYILQNPVLLDSFVRVTSGRTSSLAESRTVLRTAAGD
jgi:REP element-mobilizing transposase RayT